MGADRFLNSVQEVLLSHPDKCSFLELRQRLIDRYTYGRLWQISRQLQALDLVLISKENKNVHLKLTTKGKIIRSKLKEVSTNL